MKIAISACFAATVAVSALSGWAQELPSPANVESIPVGVPLRVELEKSYRLRVGTRIEGRLTEPVYLVDHIVLPENSTVYGSITGKHPVTRQVRTAAMFNGDLTPLKAANVTFNEIDTPDGRQYSIETNASERTSHIVRVAEPGLKERRTFGQHIAAAFRWTKTQAVAAIRSPHKSDSLRQMLYEEIPVHPQELWAGTEYDAELVQPLALDGEPAPQPVAAASLGELKLSGKIEARLMESVDSATATPGTPVEAVLTAPLFEDEPAQDEPAETISAVSPSTVALAAVPEQKTLKPAAKHKLVLPEGTRLLGSVVQAKAAGMFGRNGSLRLSFQKVELPRGDERVVHGQIIAAEGGRGSHLQIDPEGAVKATTSVTRFLMPVSLESLAVNENASSGLLHEAMTGNGFDMLTRVAGTAFSSAGLVSGFAYYEAGKIVFDQMITRGHDVTFAKNTRLEIELNEHDNGILLTERQIATPEPVAALEPAGEAHIQQASFDVRSSVMVDQER